MVPSQDIVLENADSELDIVSVFYDAEKQIQQINQMDGTVEKYYDDVNKRTSLELAVELKKIVAGLR